MSRWYTRSDIYNKRSSEIGAKLTKCELNNEISKERGRTKRIEVDVRRIRPGNEGERSRSRIEVIRSLTKVRGTQYDIIVV